MNHGISSLENNELHTGVLLCQSCRFLLRVLQSPVDAPRRMQWIEATLLVCFVLCLVDSGYDIHDLLLFIMVYYVLLFIDKLAKLTITLLAVG